jgi:hypothetical protein
MSDWRDAPRRSFVPVFVVLAVFAIASCSARPTPTAAPGIAPAQSRVDTRNSPVPLTFAAPIQIQTTPDPKPQTPSELELAYEFCMTAAVEKIDDGVSDARTIGQVVLSACEPELVALLHSKDISISDNLSEGESLALSTYKERMAITAVLKSRSSPHTGANESPDLLLARSADESHNYEREVKILIPLADRGSISAQYMLGGCFLEGRGVKVDKERAFYWYLKAAESGDSYSQLAVGMSYEHGEGTKKDINTAIVWYKKSAEQDNPYAQFRLGNIYFTDEYIPRNIVLARMWTELSDSGLPDSDPLKKGMPDVLEIIDKDMTATQIAKSQQLMSDWRGSHPIKRAAPPLAPKHAEGLQ